MLLCAPSHRSLFGSLHVRTHNALLGTETLRPFEKPAQLIGFLKAMDGGFAALDESCAKEDPQAHRLPRPQQFSHLVL